VCKPKKKEFPAFAGMTTHREKIKRAARLYKYFQLLDYGGAAPLFFTLIALVPSSPRKWGTQSSRAALN